MLGRDDVGSLSEERVCKIWHSLMPYAKKVGYLQLFLDRIDCERMDGFMDIVDVDNVYDANLTRFQHNYKRDRTERWLQTYYRRQQGSLRHDKLTANWHTAKGDVLVSLKSAS